jgi:hypothetical protein
LNPFNTSTFFSPALNASNWSPVPSGGDTSNGVSGPFTIQQCQAGFSYGLNYTATNANGTGSSNLTIAVSAH